MFDKKELVARRTRFMEICEKNPEVGNLTFSIKIVRLFIRYVTRLFGFSVSARCFDYFLTLTKKISCSPSRQYITYLIMVNKLNIEYLLSVANNNFTDAINKKSLWAEYTLRHSKDLKSKWTAKNYLSLLQKNNIYIKNISSSNRVFSPLIAKKRSEIKFYIYGPNSKNAPSNKYSDHILVFLKPMNFEVSNFKGSILFTNGIYYRSVVANNKDLRNHLVSKYSEIIVSCQTSELTLPFKKARFPISDHIAAPMALGRLLYNLMYTHGNFSCVIEGFDFYLSEAMYGRDYPSLARQADNSINEQLICSGLAAHDALYNFLYVRELVNILDLEDSESFKKIIKMDGHTYLNELASVRNFKTLLKQ
jgi:hypothetical protein